MYDLVIIGGGPAGAAAAIYAARKQLKTALVVEDWGGQSAVSSDIQNWVGTPTISGADLADSLKKHVEAYAGDILDIKRGARATALVTFDDYVEITTNKGLPAQAGEKLEALTALVATGANRRTLDIPGAKEYDQKGLTYCASCDGPLFADKDVAVIGGGNAGFETVLQLLAYCKSVTLLNRTDAFRADEISVASAMSHPHMKAIMNAVPVEVIGEQFVTALRYRDSASGTETTMPVEGIFVEIGLLPNTGWVGEALAKNIIGQIVVDPKQQRASHPRVWAAGDCTDGLYHQNNIAAGDAVKALEDIYLFLRKATSEI